MSDADRITHLARHYLEEDGGEQQLDELLTANLHELLGGFEDEEPPGPPDAELWPHRAHEIPERAWKRWLESVNDALDGGSYTLSDFGLVVYLVMDPTSPRMSLHALDLDGDEDEPEVTVAAAQALIDAILARLQVPNEAFGVAAQRLGSKLDKMCKRMYNVRTRPPGHSVASEQRLVEERESLLETFRDCYAPDVPDPDLWPQRAREISDETWEDWLTAIDDTLDEYNDLLQDIDLQLVLTMDRRQGPELGLRTMEDEPARGAVARTFVADTLEALRVPRPALELLLATRAELIERACRRLSFVEFA